MNPFTVGQSLIVQFGTRQHFTVTALRTGSPDTPAACAMRFPNSTFVKWYSVADLLRWNPTVQPKPLLMLDAPRIVESPNFQRVQMVKLTVGDLVLHRGSTYLVAAIGDTRKTSPYPKRPTVIEYVRDAVLQSVRTFEVERYQFRDIGHGAERVVGRAS